MSERAGPIFGVAILLLIGCVGGPSGSPQATEPVQSGGTLRLVVPGDQGPWGLFPEGDPRSLDPHADHYSLWELFRCCLTRTLVSNNGQATAQGGARVQPDLALSLPDISSDGRTWTFQLKRGIHYAPPLADVEVTAGDFVRSFHRALAPQFVEAGASGFYRDIVGANAYSAGEASSITGLETPDSHTLIIRLERPAGDFAPRLAVPIISPLPPSPVNPNAPFGVAEGHDDGYGPFLVATGPYMLDGAAEVDFGSPAEARAPATGLQPGQRIVLVRNPSWERSSDPLRAALPDRVELAILPTLDDALAAIYSGQAELLLNYGAVQAIPDHVAEEIAADPTRGRLHVNEVDFVAGLMMNVAIPPFDDLNVRRAVAHAINREQIVERIGGPLVMRPAHHMVPDAMVDNLLLDYRPYGAATGNLDAAKAEMRQSRYDTDGDGLCDAPECAGIRGLTRDLQPFPDIAEGVRADLAAVGLDLAIEAVSVPDFFVAYADPTQHIAMFIPLAWVKDHLSPANFFTGQFYGPNAISSLDANGSLVGATSEQLAGWGYEVTSVPNVDARIEACIPLTGTAQFECWAALDQHMTENVVASISYGSGVSAVLASTNVQEFVWDQLAGAPAFDRIRLTP